MKSNAIHLHNKSKLLDKRLYLLLPCRIAVPNSWCIYFRPKGFCRNDEGIFLQPWRPNGFTSMINTILDKPLTAEMMHNYFRTLVDKFFKILPVWEEERDTLGTYMNSLQLELLGLREFVVIMKDDQKLLSLLSILQYLIDNPECTKSTLRREVFHAISICNKLDVDYFKILSESDAGGVVDESMECV